MYLWLKLLHVFFIIAWFAGLFYLPRIYVNMAMVSLGSVEYQRLLLMAEKSDSELSLLPAFLVAEGTTAPLSLKT